jgi:hypothetical protein
MTFKAYKFKVENPEHSQKIQEHLFSLGYKWYHCGDKVQCTNKSYLFAEVDGSIAHSIHEVTFTEANNQEVELKETISYEIVPVAPAPKTVEIKILVNGEEVKYDQTSLTDLLKTLGVNV